MTFKICVSQLPWIQCAVKSIHSTHCARHFYLIFKKKNKYTFHPQT